MNLDVTYSRYFDGHSISTSFTDLETDIVRFNEELRAFSRSPIKPISRMAVTVESIRVRRNDLDRLKNCIETMINRLDTMQGEYTLLLEELTEKQ